MKKTLAILGVGKMGSALCHGLRASLPDLTLVLADRHAENLKKFQGLKASIYPEDILHEADAVLIAVKPQSFDALTLELGDALRDKLVISILAGKTLKTLQEKTGSKRVVRSMPNLGVQVGRGMSAWIPTNAVTQAEEDFVRSLFLSVGKEMKVKNEVFIDSFTVIAGSGPAYFFQLCETLRCEAERLGFSTDTSRLMAEETFMGSAKLLQSGEKKSDEWVKEVASKGGVTEAALASLKENGFDGMYSKAIEKALKRSTELNG